jgi:Fe2+ or Zn2+ uptake regulation protein
MTDIEPLLSALKQQRRRITQARIGVLTILAEAEEPLGALDIHAKMRRKRLRADKVTVYRELELLEKLRIAGTVVLHDGIRRYELLSDQGHKHHLVCTSCKSVDDVAMSHDDLASLEKTIRTKKKFAVQSHSLEFYGLCGRCR